MMRRIAVLGVFSLTMACVSTAQTQPLQLQPGQGHIQTRQATLPELRDDAKLRYLTQQLDLTDDQRKQIDGLLEVYAESVKTHNEKIRNSVEQLRSLYAEMEEANKAGNKEKADQVRQQIQDFATNKQSEEEFVNNLSAILTPEQKTELEKARKRLARNPSGELRPVDIIALARELNLSPDQNARLDEVRLAFRAEVNNARSFTRGDRDAYLVSLLNQVRAILDEKQVAQLNARAQKMALPSQNLSGSGAANAPPTPSQPQPPGK